MSQSVEEIIQQIEEAEAEEILEFDFEPAFNKLRTLQQERDESIAHQEALVKIINEFVLRNVKGEVISENGVEFIHKKLTQAPNLTLKVRDANVVREAQQAVEDTWFRKRGDKGTSEEVNLVRMFLTYADQLEAKED